MFKYIKLNKTNMKTFKDLNESRTNFNILNEDFFQEYNNSNFFKKMFLKNNVILFKSKNRFNGYVWISSKDKYTYKINSLHVNCYDKEYNFLKNIFKNSKKKLTFSYTCQNNGFNINLLEKLGFYKTDGTIEMLLNLSNYCHSFSFKNIEFEKFKKGREHIRCFIQNEVFKQASRQPLTISDIKLDEVQEYYFEPGAIFIKKNGKYIGYGQIILQNDIPVIVNVGILKNYRHNGYGRMLIGYLIKLLINNDFRNVLINVNYNNLPALKLYKSCGFIPINENFHLYLKT